MDYSLLCKKSPTINTKYGFSLPVPPVTLGIGIVVVLLLVAGIVLGCYVYQMGKTFKIVTGTVKKVTEKPLSGCHLLFSRMFKCTQPIMSPPTTRRQRTIKDVPETKPQRSTPSK